MTDEELIENLREAFVSGCDYLLICSRRQDIGFQKCERGVGLGLLRFREHEIGDQETQYRYYWTEKARELWKQPSSDDASRSEYQDLGPQKRPATVSQVVAQGNSVMQEMSEGAPSAANASGLPNIAVGKTVLVTTCDWFYAPDGQAYKAVFGTVKGVFGSEATLGVRTNAKSTNWYLDVGRMTIAGCQIHYLICCDQVHLGDAEDWSTHEGRQVRSERPSCIYNAD